MAFTPIIARWLWHLTGFQVIGNFLLRSEVKSNIITEIQSLAVAHNRYFHQVTSVYDKRFLSFAWTVRRTETSENITRFASMPGIQANQDTFLPQYIAQQHVNWEHSSMHFHKPHLHTASQFWDLKL